MLKRIISWFHQHLYIIIAVCVSLGVMISCFVMFLIQNESKMQNLKFQQDVNTISYPITEIYSEHAINGSLKYHVVFGNSDFPDCGFTVEVSNIEGLKESDQWLVQEATYSCNNKENDLFDYLN